MEKYYVDEAVVTLRPSGNPLTMPQYRDMLNSPDISTELNEVQSIDYVRVFAGGNAAVVTLKMHQVFSYKGTPNDDIAAMSLVLEKVNGSWKCVHAQRATGQAPK